MKKALALCLLLLCLPLAAGCSLQGIADAYGFGPKQLQKFFTALQDNTDELERMRAEVDEEYAFEKLRQKAQAVTGMEVHYLYEQEALLAEMQAAKEGVSAHE